VPHPSQNMISSAPRRELGSPPEPAAQHTIPNRWYANCKPEFSWKCLFGSNSSPLRSASRVCRSIEQNEKATRQLGGLLFSRENSSNGGKAVKTFCTKSYEPKKQGVKRIL